MIVGAKIRILLLFSLVKNDSLKTHFRFQSKKESGNELLLGSRDTYEEGGKCHYTAMRSGAVASNH